MNLPKRIIMNYTSCMLMKEYLEYKSEGDVRAWIKKYGKIKTSKVQITSNDEFLKLQKENQEIKTENEKLDKKIKYLLRSIDLILKNLQ